MSGIFPGIGAHQPNQWICEEGCCGHCVACGYDWPCPTALEARREVGR